MAIPGTSSAQPVKEFITVICGEDQIDRGNVVRFAWEDENVVGGDAGGPPTLPDGVTVLKCNPGRNAAGIAMETALRSESFRVQTYGFCNYLLTNGGCGIGSILYCVDLGITGGLQFPDATETELFYGSSLARDTNLPPDTIFITGAWVNFK